jgi:hypothetical protein
VELLDGRSPPLDVLRPHDGESVVGVDDVENVEVTRDARLRRLEAELPNVEYRLQERHQVRPRLLERDLADPGVEALLGLLHQPGHDLVPAVWVRLVLGEGIAERQVDPVRAVEGADVEVGPRLGLEAGLLQFRDDDLLERGGRKGRVVVAAPAVTGAAGGEQDEQGAGEDKGPLEHPHRMPAAPGSVTQRPA